MSRCARSLCANAKKSSALGIFAAETASSAHANASTAAEIFPAPPANVLSAAANIPIAVAMIPAATSNNAIAVAGDVISRDNAAVSDEMISSAVAQTLKRPIKTPWKAVEGHRSP